MNPFREKATRARSLADRLNRPTPHESGMAAAFPLGAGFGRGSARSRGRRLEASISRAGKAVAAEQRARYLQAQADAFDRGEIDVQGRARNAARDARGDARQGAAARRAVRVEAARTLRDSLPRHEVPPEVWADAAGYLAGSARALVMQEQADFIACATGVPA